YTASCTIAASATGSLSNTATVAAPGGVTDPNPGNNSATDTDALTTVAANIEPTPLLGRFSLIWLAFGLLAVASGARQFRKHRAQR
ncbi:MAG: hypothetical protein ACM3KT_05800, partial [Deltaproteobacteria bacterium]